MKRKVYLFGDPVAHSKSPQMHNAAYEALGLADSFVYEKKHIVADVLAEAIAGLRDESVAGANITVPHKQSVMAFLDEIDPLAKKFGAVNTIVNKQGKLIGYNTDGPGYIRSLLVENQFNVKGKKVAMFGAGGAASAIAFSLEEAGAISLAIGEVDLKRSAALAKQVDIAAGYSVGSTDFLEQVAQADLVINATPLGMEPFEDKTPLIELSVINPTQLYSDVVYAPQNTLFLRNAANQGAGVHYGIGMLLYQGVIGFSYFTGVPLDSVPVDKMKKALLQA